MHFQFFIEDSSGEILIKKLTEKLALMYPEAELTFDFKSFKGIGGFTPKNTVKETKSGKLLNDLATYLRGFNRSLKGIPAAIFIVLDNDDRNTEQFRKELNDVAEKNGITIDHVFCLAIEEMEAWLLGDEAAVINAYPNAKLQILHGYIQDSICGTWEKLADVVYPGGFSKMKKDCPTYREKGTVKCEWAEKIGHYMDLDCNKSESFNYFISQLKKRCS